MRSHYAEGWHATGTLGSFGAAAAAANLLGLDARDHRARARHRGHAGRRPEVAVRHDVQTAARGPRGGRGCASRAPRRARLQRAAPTFSKPRRGSPRRKGHGASAERFNRALDRRQLPARRLLQISRRLLHDAFVDRSDPRACQTRTTSRRDDVRDVEISVNEGHFGVCNIQAPTTGLEAKFSLRFTAAMALSGRDTSGIDTYTDALTHDPALVALRDQVGSSPGPTRAPKRASRIGVGNDAYETATNVGIPLTDLDAQWAKLIRKFHALVDPLLGGNERRDNWSKCAAISNTKTDLDAFWRCIRGARMSEPDFRARASSTRRAIASKT